MLSEEVKRYRELSGDNNPNTPISRIGGYLDGYEKAMEQEPCEDAISRQAVMDCFKKWQPYMATRLWDFEQELSALPSVNPQEPKTDILDKRMAEINEYGSLWVEVESMLEQAKQQVSEIIDKCRQEG